MASIQKTAKGYRAQVAIKGERDSQTFRTKREADAWASQRETEIRQRLTMAPDDKHTLGDLLGKYREEVSPTKRGYRWEEVRINKLLRDKILYPSLRLSQVTSELVGEWRNDRLTQISPGAVLREFSLLSAIFTYARQELKWMKENPISDVRRPRAPDHRRVLISRRKIRLMLETMGYTRNGCVSVSQACAVAFLLALRTGMRAGEVCGLTWDRVFDDHCKTSGKTAAATRDVPLTYQSRQTIERMRGFDPVLVFGISSASLDAMFRKYRNRAGLEGFTFHDSRHTAATWLARRLHVLDLCLMFGWTNTKQALTYYNASASSIVKQLSRPKHDQPQ